MSGGRGARVWIDISNTPQVQFFAPLVPRLATALGRSPMVTLREKNETVELAKLRGFDARAIGRDYDDGFRKAGAMALRTLRLSATMPAFDVAVSFENPMTIPVARLRRKPSVLMFDNDLKFDQSDPSQRIESRIKRGATHVLVPGSLHAVAEREFPRSEIATFDGIKEHLHILGFTPQERPTGIPFEGYAVVRPEAFESRYVGDERSLVPDIVRGLVDSGVPVVLLDRKDPYKLAGYQGLVHVPTAVVDGLQLIHHARAMLTGSGTMAREAAVLGVPAVSFFPGSRLLVVDQNLADAGRVFHSRSADGIVKHVLSAPPRRAPELDQAKRAAEEIVRQLERIARGEAA